MGYVLEIKSIKKCYLFSKKAEPVPPLGTMLGNLGLSTVKFCEEFNSTTSGLPNYFLLKVIIDVYENRTWKIGFLAPSTGFFLKLLMFEKKFKVLVNKRMHDKIFKCINLNDILKLSLFKYPGMDLIKSFTIINGSVKAMGLKII